jgi:transposase
MLTVYIVSAIAQTLLPTMAPNLGKSQHNIINIMIPSKAKATEIATAARCDPRSVRTIREKIRVLGTANAPRNRPGRKRSITPCMLDALCEHLLEKPRLYQSEIIVFLWDEFEVLVTASSIGRALASKGWTKKTIRRVAQQRNADLRDLYLYNLSNSFRSYHLVYVDKSGCDKRVGFRRTGWSPVGVTPIQIAQFQREKRYQILPAYTQDGILFARIFQGFTDSEAFEDLIEYLLPSCGRWPEPKSVLVMDNASFHHSERIEQMCQDAGVKLIYLPPYSPDLNPIEEFFAELKAFIKRNWQVYEADQNQGFDGFLDWCIDIVGRKEQSAKGHFRHAGWEVEEL